MTSSRSKAVVTGASAGIGEAIARRLAADGAKVLLAGRNIDELERVAAAICAEGGEAFPFAGDFVQRETAAHIVEAAFARMDGIDMLVNCASQTLNHNIFELSDDEWQLGFEVKLFATIRLIREAWPALKQGCGSVVNIGGAGARTPQSISAMSAASSSALAAVTKALAQSGITDGVQVNAIHPGLVRTPRIERTFAGDAASEAEIEQVLALSSERAGMVRAGRPEDVASLVAFIVSPAGEMLQGAIIDLDGGMT
jgi:NAD(P)-dependent dehydrogenase (short-subunit alcohol dehydrogenase family)